MGRPRKSQARKDARGELIEAAWRLFSSYGYEATTVEAIIAEVGLSKGAFYHYFSSKEDVLDAVVGLMIEEITMQVKPIPDLPSLSTMEKLGRFMESVSNWKLANIGIIKETVAVIFRDQNAIVRQKMNREAVESLAPVLAEIMQQGVDEGVFQLEYPEDTAEAIMHFSNAMSEMQAASLARLGEDPRVPDVILRRAQLFLGAVERIIGAPEGSVYEIDRGLVERFERAIINGGVS